MTSNDPIADIEADHACLLRLCDVLEAIADGLPGLWDREKTVVAIDVLRHGLIGHARLEDVALFPLLRRRADGDRALASYLAQLESEHVHDTDFAFELADELDGLLLRGRTSRGDQVGYMLRGFFIAQRRHIEWENVAVLPVARRVLAGPDLAALADALGADDQIMASRRTIRSIRL